MSPAPQDERRPDPTILLTLDQVAERLGISRKQVSRYVSGRIGRRLPVVSLGKLVRVREVTLARWLEEGEL